jgi:hypothetical protein
MALAELLQTAGVTQPLTAVLGAGVIVALETLCVSGGGDGTGRRLLRIADRGSVRPLRQHGRRRAGRFVSEEAARAGRRPAPFALGE